MIIGTGNSLEAALVDRLEVLPAQHLLQVSAHLHGREFLSPQQRSNPVNNQQIVHLGDIIGQGHAKRALEIAAAGFHNLLFFGPPGTGKTMLASRLAGLMPPLNNQQALQVATIHSVAGHGLRNDFSQRPFRAPHHTASAAALVGGGSSPRPGEISLAHHGVLFLDELPEFSRKVLEVLREPMESGEITISRAAAKLTFPARFQLVAAMNPCPCGYLGDNRCNCSPDQVRRYLGKISGPLLDRIDLQVRVANIDNRQLMTRSKNEMDDSTHLLQRISRAQKLQLERQGKLNAQLENREVEALCPFDAMIERELERAIAHFRLSTRGFYRLLRTARTIADLAEAGAPELPHYREALSFRMASDLNI